ncbi:Uncharacterised protein [Legionella gratiana]|uniref:Uncharacterized protein n=1 Tax=Legionella gratiana TaxID=45066 RepID=A0A378J852_9GAMM|nr:Uncharacterised protein [Legionella gratiana]
MEEGDVWGIHYKNILEIRLVGKTNFLIAY